METEVRILQVVAAMNRGGLETMLMNYYRNIDRTRVQFDFLTHRSERAAYDDEIEALGGRIFHIPKINPMPGSGYFKALDMFFKQHPEYKIVHSHINTFSMYILRAAKRNNVPYRISHSHASRCGIAPNTVFKFYCRKNLTKYTTQCFSCGKVAGDWLFSGKEYKIVPNAIDAEKYIYNEKKADEMKKQLGLSNKLVIGHIGNFTAVKNYPFIISTFHELTKKCDESALLLIGKGPLWEETKQKAAELEIADKVIMLGLRSDVCELLQAVDVFLFPSMYEGLPVTLVEAQAAGVPVLTTDTVDKNVKMTDNVFFKGLSDTDWSDKLLELSKIEKKNTYDDIVNASYDIKSNAKWLENYYLSLK